MKMSDFVSLVASGARPVVEFVAGIDNKESFAEKGMRARALRVRDEDAEVVRIEFDFAEFESLNLPMQSANYYDKKREPTLTAVEAGFYKPQDHMYIDRDESLEQLFVLVTGSQSALFAQYREATADSPMSYVAWLEFELTKVRAATPA